ncbi:hypothetical protein [Cryobacterium sp. TMT4-31]|uniref:hypothetical protein n=1 Tax=Cryobacterium sp. TMT4-31 TaxID=1259259 RepID=UPI00141B655C|nr:hypothetical protein [Cryobacterium sp. TMT4-31]
MSYLLHIDASSLDSGSFSRQVATSFRDTWGGDVTYRNLAAAPVTFFVALDPVVM